MSDSFVYEESLMLSADYSQYSAHKAGHEVFMAEFLERYTKSDDAMEILLFLSSWIERHLKESDSNLGMNGVRRQINGA